jgi:hypothetical protein
MNILQYFWQVRPKKRKFSFLHYFIRNFFKEISAVDIAEFSPSHLFMVKEFNFPPLDMVGNMYRKSVGKSLLPQ